MRAPITEILLIATTSVSLGLAFIAGLAARRSGFRRLFACLIARVLVPSRPASSPTQARRMFDAALDAIGKIWTIPNTMVGTAIGLAGVPFGAIVSLANNAIQFERYPWGTGALTLGNAIIYGGGTAPEQMGHWYGDDRSLNLGLHERAHTCQYQILGPFFPLVYFLAGGISARNPFERAANDYAGSRRPVAPNPNGRAGRSGASDIMPSRFLPGLDKMSISTDVAIIGAGPCGLFQVFELGLLDLKAHVIDSLPKVGGQCAELYPDKPIYDIPGYPIVGAQELVDKLLDQIKPFKPEFHLGAPVTELQRQDDGTFRVVTGAGTAINARAVVIAGGVGAFAPVPLRIDGVERFTDTQLFYRVRDPSAHHGKKVVVLGGGDSALDWALALYDKCDLTLVHRSAVFKAAPASVSRLKLLGEEGKLKWMSGSALGFGEENGRLNSLKITALDRSEHLIETDHILAFYGLSPKLGPIAEWGLTLNKNQIEVDTEKFQTSQAGIYAVGDINSYPGKKKLILSGFHEGALAAFAIKHQLYPNEKVFLQYTTTSPAVHKKLGVETPAEAAS